MVKVRDTLTRSALSTSYIWWLLLRHNAFERNKETEEFLIVDFCRLDSPECFFGFARDGCNAVWLLAGMAPLYMYMYIGTGIV